jgi:hypothetical protein
MNLIMPRLEAHPVAREEVMVVDKADVNVCRMSISNIRNLRERMGAR